MDLKDKESFLTLLQHLEELFQVEKRIEDMLNQQVSSMTKAETFDLKGEAESLRYKLPAQTGGQME